MFLRIEKIDYSSEPCRGSTRVLENDCAPCRVFDNVAPAAGCQFVHSSRCSAELLADLPPGPIKSERNNPVRPVFVLWRLDETFKS
jgi:hypothetical protein